MNTYFPSSKIFSFDIFDTCITRMHAYPRDLFFDLGLRLAPAEASEKARQRFAKRFQRARIRAEKIANWCARRKGGEHANIYAIYRYLPWLMRLDHSADELVAIELALEEESIYPILEMLAHIEELRTAGQRIVFISDMYIPGQLLGPLLIRKGVMHEGDALYVSCDMGCSKHNGRLFDEVLEREQLNASAVLHVGDNLHADICMAQARGIEAQHFTAAHLQKHETAIAGRRISRSPAASWQAAFSRRSRLAVRHEIGSDESHSQDGVMAGIVVPFLLAYVQWVLDDAHQRGIQRLYFVARDGEVLFKIANSLKPEGIELRYLYGSRRAWLAPSISPNQTEWRRLLAVAGNACSPHDIASRAGLDAVAQAKLCTALGMDDQHWVKELGLDEASSFIDSLIQNPVAAALLQTSALDKRKLALMFFQQEGLQDNLAWALVDSGWSLNSQAALKRTLDQAGVKYPCPQGYYLGLALDHLEETKAGKAYPFVTPPGSIFSRRRVVVEHCFLPASHASTQGYKLANETVVPDFSCEARDDAEMNYALRLHAIATAAATMLAKNPDTFHQLRCFTPEIREVAAHFICNPTREDALAMSQLTAIADMRQEDSFAVQLCRPLQLRDVWSVLFMGLSKRHAFKTNAWMWLEGSSALSPYFIQVVIRIMLGLDGLKNRLHSKKQINHIQAQE